MKLAAPDAMAVWFGSIPPDWGMSKLKYLANFRSGDGITSERIETEGNYPVYGGNGLRGYTDSFTHNGDHILIGRQGALCGNINYASGKFWASEHAVVVTPRPGIAMRWMGELLRSMNLLQYSQSAAQPGLSVDFIVNLTVPVASPGEQQAISAFLDRETAKIDALISKKKELVELLQEKRSALISHAVTKGIKGLGDSAKLYSEMWTETRLGRVIKLQRGFDITGAADGEGDIPVISSGGISGHCSTPIVRGPGVIVGRKGTLGTVHFCEGDYWPHDTTLWVRDFGSNLPRFVYYFLLHMRLESYDVGAANPTLNRNHVHPVIVRWPDVESQQRIALYLDRASEVVDPLIAKVMEAIARLSEYRTALISAAVTGNIDVRGEVD